MKTPSTAARVVVATIALLALGIATAEARPGGGGSFGSRGGRTFSAPPSTMTAPRPAAPIERSITQPSMPSPGMTAPAAGRTGGFFGRPGFGSGLIGGLLGAGLIGMLFGNGMFGGMGGFASFIGLLLQAALIFGLVKLAFWYFRSRQQPAMAGGLQRQDSGAGPMGGGLGNALGGMGLGRGASAAQGRPASSEPVDAIGIGPADYEAFEKTLLAINAAWDREDVDAMRNFATPEMVAYFREDLAANTQRGLHDRVGQVKLLQGDLAESWREGTTDYATVAMRFSLLNAMIEKATGRVVEGDSNRPKEVTEIWTFRRDSRGPWVLSAIQQA